MRRCRICNKYFEEKEINGVKMLESSTELAEEPLKNSWLFYWQFLGCCAFGLALSCYLTPHDTSGIISTATITFFASFVLVGIPHRLRLLDNNGPSWGLVAGIVGSIFAHLAASYYFSVSSMFLNFVFSGLEFFLLGSSCAGTSFLPSRKAR